MNIEKRVRMRSSDDPLWISMASDQCESERYI